MDRRTRLTYELFAQEGVEVVSVTQGRGTHLKIHCRYRGYEFTYVCSRNVNGDDQCTIQNRVADLRRIKRAVRSGTQEILDKFKVKRVSA